MIGHRCKNCLWFDNQHESIKLVPLVPGKYRIGFCRKKIPGAIRIGDYFYGVQPVRDEDEFCGEFKKDV